MIASTRAKPPEPILKFDAGGVPVTFSIDDGAEPSGGIISLVAQLLVEAENSIFERRRNNVK